MSLIYIIKNGKMTPYIGSTTQSLKIRLQSHYYKKKTYENNKGNNCASFILLNGNETIELLEECEIADRFVREQHYIDTIPNCNINAAYCTEEQRKAYDKEAAKAYYQANKEAIKEATKNYREANREKVKEANKNYREPRKEAAKAYREANKEKLKEYRRARYLKSKLI
jgi:hypothetical protein